MTEKPALGTVVQLNSGGPKMTVSGPVWERPDMNTAVESKDKVRCKWFDGTEAKGGDFHIATLREVEEGDGPRIRSL